MAADAADAPATIMVWRGAFSRMVDYLETNKDIDARRIAVVGHSRNGRRRCVAAASTSGIAIGDPAAGGLWRTAPSRVRPSWRRAREANDDRKPRPWR